MIAPAIRTTVEDRLCQIEAEEAVTIFYACESGSRAWGFPSADSDYDVRFLYLHPRDWYLSINLERKRDVIERPIEDDLDLSGWDLRKALVEDEALQEAISDLLARKRTGAEMDEEPRITPIHAFIERELARWNDHRFTYSGDTPPIEPFNAFFREALRRVEEDGA